MPGGGPHGVQPGQITDDCELAMCLMWGLIKGNQKCENLKENVLNTFAIASYYGMWINSNPFDIG